MTVTPVTSSELALGQRLTPSDMDVRRLWREGYLRLFLSHVSRHKVQVSQLKAVLFNYGVSAFVAHEDIEPSLESQNEISLALRSMHALVALITSDFHASNWTDQELGWALGRGIPVLPVRLGADPTFSPHSYGFRPGRSAHQAVAAAQGFIAAGYRWVVDLDLEKFFDRVNHDLLMGRLAKRIDDPRLLRLIRAFLNAGVLEDGLVSPTDEGTPQGGPLSPLLSNIVLDDFDQELTRRGLHFARYADDCNIYVRSRRAGERVLASVTRYLTGRLKLKVNESKSAVTRPWERKFLGFSFTSGKVPKRRIAPKALDRFKERVRELTRRTKGVSLEQLVTKLSRYLQGWRGYFGACETPSVLRDLDSWIQRRLRSFLWKQWRTGRTKFAELHRRHVRRDLAAQTAGSCHGPWRLSKSPALHIAFPTAFFTALGLPTLAPKPA